MNPWLRNLLCGGGGGGGGPVLPPTGRTMLANLTSSLILDEGTGGPTWSRATKAWGFNELGYLKELASGCAFFGGARLVRNTVRTTSEDFSNAAWPKDACTVTGTNTIVCSNATDQMGLFQSSGLVPNVVIGQNYLYGFRVRYVSGGAEFVQVLAGALGFGIDFINVSLLDGTSSTTGGVFSRVTEVVPGTYDIILRAVADANAAGEYAGVAFCSSLSSSRYENFVGDGIKSFELLRAWSVDVTNYDTSYVPEYVSVGVEASPYFGAGIDGAKYFETDWQGAPIAAANLLGFRREAAATNNLLHSRDLGNAAWSTKTNITAAKTATGLDGIANTATTLTATAADASILQPITLTSAARCASAYVKRRTGTGTISFTQDGGSTWTDITAQINSSTWSRVEITATLANPSVGFKLSTSGDAIDVDCVQNEAGAVATSPIVTTTAAITRNVDSLTYQTASNIDSAVGTIFYIAHITSDVNTTRYAIKVGASGSYLISSTATRNRNYDGTNICEKTGLSDIRTAPRKRAVTWGPAGLSSTGDGLVPQTSAFDGDWGDGTSISIFSSASGYIGPVAIYNYQMTDAELQALTT